MWLYKTSQRMLELLSKDGRIWVVPELDRSTWKIRQLRRKTMDTRMGKRDYDSRTKLHNIRYVGKYGSTSSNKEKQCGLIGCRAR